MTTAQKHLRDLLTEDQEPFILQNYIADRRRSHFTRQNPATTATTAICKKLKPTFTSSNLCNSVCFSFPESPDSQRSPLPAGFAPPCKTAALILEAASRIRQKTDSASAPIKRGLFGSILRRLTQRNHRRRRKPEIDVDRRRKLPTGGAEKRGSSIGRAGHSRRSSAWWSESNGEWSLGELEESTSGSDDGGADDRRESSVSDDGREDWEFDLMDGQLCKSPFKSSGHRSPEFSPPVAPSPVRHGKEETRDDYDVESPTKLEGSDEQQQDKEQCSPVSILDPAPFEDEEVASEIYGDYEDEDEHGHGDVDRDRDYDCSYANVQRAKQQLLEKLYRFEKLAELDPVELEKRMSEQDSDDDDDDFEDDDELTTCRDQQMTVEEFTKEVTKSRFGHMKKIPSDMRNLVSDLISEEWGKHDGCSESLMKRVCGKLESWKEVDSDTIDMMVEDDFRRSEIVGGWKQIAQEQVGDIVLQIEGSIFESLATEFFLM